MKLPERVICSLLIAYLSHAWILLPSRRFTTKLCSSSSQENNETPIDDPNSLFVHRVFYQFTRGSDVELHDSMVIEERVRFEPAGDGYVRPVGPRTILLRDGQVEDGEIGDEFFALDVGKSHSGAGTDYNLEATLATALYLASNPSFCRKQVLEVASELGLASLLGCIGAGHVLRSTDPSDDTDEDDILSIPKNRDTLLPDALECLFLTEQTKERTDALIRQLKDSGISSPKITAQPLDWTKRQQRSVEKDFYTIVASDVAFTYPEAKELARTVAHRLQPAAAYLNAKDPLPRFLHVCPDAREDCVYLRQILEKGYRMTCSNGYLKLEKIVFYPQRINKTDDEIVLDGIPLEVRDFRETEYSSLTSSHHWEYVEGMGEYFFPIETGEYDSPSNIYTESERKGPW